MGSAMSRMVVRKATLRAIPWHGFVGLLVAVFVLALPASALADAPGVADWGSNEVGQMGNGTTTESNLRVGVSGLSGVTAIAGGNAYGLALMENGTVTAWGHNEFGQLGDGTTTGPGICPGFGENTPCSTTPVPVSGLSSVTAIAAGGLHSLALLSNGTVMAWGDNESGELGDGSVGGYSDVPVEVKGLTGVTAIAAGFGHSLALLSNGTVVAWGSNEFGQLGDGTTTNSDVPVAVSGLSGVTAIASGGERSLALLTGGTVVDWGEDRFGELGTGSGAPETCGGGAGCGTTPVAVSGLSGVTAVAGGYGHSLALLGDGKVMAWGVNYAGQLGNGTETDSEVPVEVTDLSGAKAIAAGRSQSLALLSDGKVMAWGRPYLGDGPEHGSSSVPVEVENLSGVTAIAAGGDNGLVITPALTTIASIAPAEGAVSGQTPVTIIGSNFTAATAVKFGSADATSFKVESETEIKAVSPPGANGAAVDVTVTTPAETSPTSPFDRFTYGVSVTKIEPAYGPPAGETHVTITGTNFTGATAVKFGSTNATSFHVNSPTSITAIAPAGAGIVDVTVSTPEGTSPTGPADQFSYAPAVTKVSPGVGKGPEGDPITITGTNFTGATAVKFGSINAANFIVESDTTIIAVSPFGQGTVDVTVTTVGGTSATSSADDFTYPEPAIYNESSSKVSEHEATLEGQINPYGEWSLETTYVFEYGTSTSYGASVPTPPGVISSRYCLFIEILPCGIRTPQPVSESLTGLEPGTTYHYRIVATNERGTNHGADATFTTQGSRARPLGGEEKPPSSSGQSGTSSTPGSGSSSPATPLVSPVVKTVKPKVLTRAQKLAKALKQCKKEPKRKRAKCQKQAKKKYGRASKKA
jgi:alpha-tubulin suppressor-like RCC1 family protein